MLYGISFKTHFMKLMPNVHLNIFCNSFLKLYLIQNIDMSAMNRKITLLRCTSYYEITNTFSWHYVSCQSVDTGLKKISMCSRKWNVKVWKRHTCAFLNCI